MNELTEEPSNGMSVVISWNNIVGLCCCWGRSFGGCWVNWNVICCGFWDFSGRSRWTSFSCAGNFWCRCCDFFRRCSDCFSCWWFCWCFSRGHGRCGVFVFLITISNHISFVDVYSGQFWLFDFDVVFFFRAFVLVFNIQKRVYFKLLKLM